MKKYIIIASAGVLSFGLMAFGYANWNNSSNEKCENSVVQSIVINSHLKANHNEKDFTDFFYDMGSRFRGIKKSITQSANSLADIVEKQDLDQVERINKVSVIVIKKDVQTEIREIGFTDKLTDGQLKLLRSMDYSTNFLIRADFDAKDKSTPKGHNYFSPHMTVVPETQAEYKGGKDALLKYLRTKNKENTKNLDEKKLSPAKLYFTVTKTGAIKNVNLDRSCNYTNIDIEMIEIITNSTGKWTPAQNAKGEKVEQELVLSFGMVGC